MVPLSWPRYAENKSIRAWILDLDGLHGFSRISRFGKWNTLIHSASLAFSPNTVSSLFAYVLAYVFYIDKSVGCHVKKVLFVYKGKGTKKKKRKKKSKEEGEKRVLFFYSFSSQRFILRWILRWILRCYRINLFYYLSSFYRENRILNLH